MKKELGMSRMPKTVVALGVVSLLMDVSSELVHALLPIYMTTVLGASMLAVGIVEGIAEATASIVKVFSGAISDRIGRRKPLVVFGYALAAVSKPLFPLAESVALVTAARFMDRVGKGIRGAPRDALIADVTAPEQRGRAFGLRQAMDTVGAFLGPLAAIGFMILLSENIRAVLWLAVIPAIFAVLVLVFFVSEPGNVKKAQAKSGHPFAAAKELSRYYWWIVALGALFSLARFSEAFLILRAQDLGMAISFVPLVMVAMNLVYTAVAYPAGAAADKGHRKGLLIWGLAALIGADILIGATQSVPMLFAGIALWGLHMGLTQGLLSTLVADAAPSHLRGTAFGVFHLVCGVALLAASVLAGWLWGAYGASLTFYAGAGFAALALLGLLLAMKKAQ